MERDAFLNGEISEANMPIDINSVEEIRENEISFSYDLGKTSFKRINFNGIRLLYGKLTFIKPVPITVHNKNPYVEMYFSLKGSRDIYFTQSKQRDSVREGYHNLYYIPDTEFYIEPSVNDYENISLQVQFTEDYFKRFLPIGHPLFSTFVEQIDDKELSILSHSDLQITPEMYTILNDIVHCDKEGVIKQLFIETSVLKLLLLQFEQYETTFVKKEYKSVKVYDIEKLQLVRRLLEENISDNHSLTELSRKSGLNDFKLKKGFKELFGATVFGYLRDLRMTTARDLLIGTSQSIAEIAEQCGYVYVQSFSTAFKSKYGITPEKFRK
ncbi:hypothetical protein AMR72_01580 [Flavobacterium psychrophilum]|nr:hypothetical protein AMR72_01580 [Flavobacterium psychrophilum]AOE51327.1 hypothetical protein ALW18_01580 [Flavobacterium psychrophilum]